MTKRRIGFCVGLWVLLIGEGAVAAVSGRLDSGGGGGENTRHAMHWSALGGAYQSVPIQTAGYRLTSGFGDRLIPARSTGDFNLDGQVDFADFLLFAGGYGRHVGDEGFDARLDLNRNDQVDFADFLLFAGAFGK